MPVKPRCKFYKVSGPDHEGNSLFRCSVCHRKPVVASDRVNPSNIHADCLPPVTLLQKATRLGKELLEWVTGGSPLRSEKEVARIYVDLCLPCENYKPAGSVEGSCKLCGCAVKKRGLLNKISLGTSHCPIGRW